MKALAFLLLLTQCSPVPAEPWTGKDKALHLVAGAALASAGTAITKDPWKGFAIGCTAGVLKEAYDSAHPATHTVSVKDAAVTCVGAALGASGTHWVLQRYGGKMFVAYNTEF